MQFHAPPESVLRWLELLLAERFGVALRLEPDGGGIALRLLATGETGLWIRQFPRLYENGPVENGTCPLWHGENEGLQPVLTWPLPAPCAHRLPSPLVERVDDIYRIGYDILGLTYWMLARKEEVGNPSIDEYGRFPALASHAYRHDYLDRPIVDEWLDVLGQLVRRRWPTLELKRHRPSVRVTHDVDSPSRYAFRPLPALLKGMVGDVLRRNIRSAAWAPWIRLNSQVSLHPKDPYNTFDWIMDLSEQNGLKSAFYFICGRNSNMDADYEPEHPAIRALMRRIYERGHEIGLHPSYDTYNNPELLKQEADRLRSVLGEEKIMQSALGGRMHYLRWTNPATIYAEEQAGMIYDSTLGYPDHAGFRCGTCFEYPAFDPVKQSILSLRIRPLIAMEGSFIDQGYMGLGKTRKAVDAILALKNACEKVNGQFILLWHNSRLVEKVDRWMYEKAVQCI